MNSDDIWEENDKHINDIQFEEDNTTTNNQFNIDGCNIISNINPKCFQDILKVLITLNKDKNTDSIKINNSQIIQIIGDCIIIVNLSNILINNVSFDIINPKKYIPLLSQLSDLSTIYIFDDIQNKQFIITDGIIRLLLPKQLKSSDDDFISDINFTDYNSICKLEIKKESRKKIKNISKDTKGTVELLIHDNKLKGINVQETAIYIFPEFINDDISQKLNEKNADLVLKLDNFLPIDAENYIINIISKEDRYIVLSDCKINNIDIRIIERAENTSGDLSIFL